MKWLINRTCLLAIFLLFAFMVWMLIGNTIRATEAPMSDAAALGTMIGVGFQLFIIAMLMIPLGIVAMLTKPEKRAPTVTDDTRAAPYVRPRAQDRVPASHGLL